MNKFISNNHFKEILKLNQKKYQKITGRVLIEGYRLLSQLSNNGIKFDELYITEDSKYEIKNFNVKQIFILKPWQIAKLCSTKSPQEIAALVKKVRNPINDKKFLLYLDKIKDPGNLGTIIRTATASEISGMILSPECCDIFNPKVIRSSSGTVFSFPLEVHNFEWLKSQKSTIIASSLLDSVNVFEFSIPKGNIILVIGSEAFGVSKEILSISNYKIKIPVSNMIESLNVAVATGILMYYFKNRSEK